MHFPNLFSRRNALALATMLLPCLSNAQSGLTIGATGTNVVTTAGITNLVVDNAVTITGATSITQATATISSGFQTGDVLSFNSGALPSGVTGSFNSTTGVLTFSGSSATPASYQALLRTVNISLSVSSATTRSVTFTLGNLGSYTNGHYYKFVSTADTWVNAKAAACAVGNKYYGLTGYLATATTVGENTYIKQTLGADGWLGASDNYLQINAATGATTYINQSASEGHWYWVTGPEAGTALSYSNWNTGEPNNSGGSEDYCEIYSSGANSGAWNDVGTSSTYGYVVEYGGISGDPTVQLSASRSISVQATSIAGTYTYNVTPYRTKASAVVVDGSLNIAAISSITNARVTVSTNFTSGDVLGYTGSLPSGVTSSYNSTTGVLSFTGTATAAQFQALLRTVTFQSNVGPNLNREVTFSLGSQVAYSNGHIYQYITSSNISWANAKTGAAGQTYLGLTGYLATITSSGENAFITQTLASNGWIGGSDDYSVINTATGTTTYANQAAAEGNWYWVTGPEAGTNFSTGNTSPAAVSSRYMNWNSGEPNNSSNNENYAQIFASGSVGKWNDLDGSSQGGYVVEFGGLSSDPVVTLTSTSLISVSTPLPIAGINLQAAAEKNTVALRWETLNEREVSSYAVERSSNAADFKSIGEKASVGTGNNSYQLTDYAPLSGTSYYRVKSFDRNGDMSYSSVVSVHLNNSEPAVSISPNPAFGHLQMINNTGGSVTVICMDVAGKTIFSTRMDEREQQLDISALITGVYYLKMVDAEGKQSVTTFTKN